MTTIVRAAPNQLDAVLTLVEQLLGELSIEPGGYQGLDRQLIAPQLLEASDRYVAFLAVDPAGEPIGVATLAEAVAAYAGGKYGIISELYVRPGNRGSGIGRLLLDAVRQEAQSRGWRRVDVTTPPDDRWHRTVSFYERYGFVFTGRKLKLWIDPPGEAE